MLLERNLHLQQKQSLHISAQTIQSLKILQFSHGELSSYLEDQAERNPLINLKLPNPTDAMPEPPTEAKGQTERLTATNAPGSTFATEKTHAMQSGGDSLGARPSQGQSRKSHDIRDAIDVIEATCPAKTTLREHLLSQIGFAFRDLSDQRLAAELIEHFDGDGYLRAKTTTLAPMLGVDAEKIEKTLKVIQGFDPAGVGARDLGECLKIQLEDLGKLRPEMEIMLDHIDLLAKFDISRLASLTGTSRDAVLEMAKEIRTLDPKPGRKFDDSPTLSAYPDILVNRTRDGRVTVELNSALLPRVLVDRQYYAEIKTQRLNEQDKRFVVDCMKNAGWLTKNLDQRAQTILKIATEIARKQDRFLRDGPEHLRPLGLKDVAAAAGVHESTVCRAIANKYMMTAHGLFELKFFFSNSLASLDGGEDQSSETVRHKIKQLIDAEKPEAVLSDDAIVAQLQSSGIEVARRTVAKYRDMMRIPSSPQRRREKRAKAKFNFA
ncbi:RNA polymerase factor sigma-54 [Celeribacter sp. PS-C1]|uniref:RNA polymerase factor sigma-54 n=1 Tax=Celeribacter sp. PS-C1 TaxID=2820813 RepID=UPI001CA5E1AF|nr:RNA polymerase factor sigma-54 [Celeribacter sp. PS-C1]MBW6418519.1 RNA polymerase factor sigma-54 [Celeribacter sp. PS-C1]